MASPPTGADAPGNYPKKRKGDDHAPGAGAPGGCDSDDEWKAKLDAAVATAFGNFLPTLQGVVSTQIAEVRSKVDSHGKQLDKHTRELQALSERQVDSANDQKELRAQVEAMRAKLAMEALLHLSSDTAPAAASRDPNQFDRTLVRVGSANMVGIDTVRAKVLELLAEAGLTAEDAHLEGPHVGKNFRLHFKDRPDTAARRAKQLLQSLKGPQGWKETAVERPGNQGSERIYLSADQSEYEGKRNFRTKKLAKIISDSGIPVAKHLRDATITFQWKLVATIDGDKIIWDDFAATSKIDTAAVDAAFAAAIAPRRG